MQYYLEHLNMFVHSGELVQIVYNNPDYTMSAAIIVEFVEENNYCSACTDQQGCEKKRIHGKGLIKDTPFVFCINRNLFIKKQINKVTEV